MAWALQTGRSFVVTTHYGTGADILDALSQLMPQLSPDAPFEQRKAARQDFEVAARRLLVPISNHRLALTGAEPIGFLAELYPELPSFFLPFIEVQSLYGAWQTYVTGVHLPVLGYRIRPFYGTYAPTRTEHLQLFATWLSAYGGAKDRAVDVGTGSGVLALMLAKAGFSTVSATDQNPNAVESVRREAGRHDPEHRIQARVTDLLEGDPGAADLIVFNPPWIPGRVLTPLDAALYFEKGLFERFFDQSFSTLAPQGRVVILFSTIMRWLRPEVAHPIEAELAKGRFQLVKRQARKIVAPRGKRTKEKVEVWELARV